MTRDDDILHDLSRRPGPTPESESPRTGGRRARRERQGRRSAAKPHPLPILIPLLVLAMAVVGIALMAPKATKSVASPAAAWTAVTTATAPAAPEPTPAFASFRGVQIHLPIDPAKITAVAFHPTSYTGTFQMKPLIELRSPSQGKAAGEAARAAGIISVEPTASPSADVDGVWTGWAVQTWRTGHYGKLDTALDCGAKPGTPVLAPVTGTVMLVRPYKLYGRVDDFEFNIKPDAWSDVDVIVLHVTDPVVQPGDRIIGGVTQIASVRKLTSVLTGISLRTFTPEGGNHTHVQLNRIIKPNEPWLVGQDPPGLKRKGD